MPIYRDESGGVGRGVMLLGQSHVLRSPQITGVIANTFFNCAQVSQRQAQMAAIVQQVLGNGTIHLHLLPGNAEGDYK